MKSGANWFLLEFANIKMEEFKVFAEVLLKIPEKNRKNSAKMITL